MAEWLKRGATAESKVDADRKVRDIIEAALADIEAWGDAAVRDLSIKFDDWDRPSYVLTAQEKQGVYRHASAATETDMTFSVFVSVHEEGAMLPVVWYLSGLTCTHANVTEKGEYRAACARHGLIFVAPDTSPRGPEVANDEAYDFGQGAGFYVDATQPPFAGQFNMWSYVTDELPALVAAHFPADLARQSIMGHSPSMPKFKFCG